MAIKDIFKMIKADRYTQDGREELIKAQEAVTEDVRYKPGDISKATGLQKQPDGSWAPVKNAPAQPKKKDASGADVLNNEYYKDDVRTDKGAQKILSETKTEVIEKKVSDLEDLKKRNGGKLGVQGEKDLQMAKTELAKRKGSTSGSGVPTQGSDWMSLPSGTRMTFEGAKEKMAKNNERIETIKKMMEGKSRADNFRLGSELKTLQNENEYIAERLPPEKKESPSASGSAPSTPQSTIIGNLSSEDKNKIYQLFNDADFRRQLDNKLEFGLDNQVGELILKKLPHGELKSKVYNLADQYNRENFSDAREYKSGLTEKAMGQLYKDYKEGKTSDSAPRILTGDCKARIKKSK